MPAGAGVREAALLLLLSSTMTAPVAAVIAVVSRLLFIVGDLAWSAVAVVAERRGRADPGQPGGRVAQMVVQGNGLVTALTWATWETKRTKPRLDQWLRCPGVLPRSRT